MSNSDREKIIAPEAQVRLLEKALMRERNAKKRLEVKLEEKLEARYDENQAFITAFENANSRQIQLQFLSMLNQDMVTDKNVHDMFDAYVRNLQKLLENCPAFLLSKEEEQWQIGFLAGSQAEWQDIRSIKNFERTFQAYHNKPAQAWHRIERPEASEFTKLLIKSTLLFYRFELSSEQEKIIFLDIDHFCYSNDFKETLDISGQSFITAVKKRMTELELFENNEELKQTLKQLKETQKQLNHHEKMVSLGKLSAGVAHEINNPIGYVTSNLDVLVDYIKLYQNAFTQLAVNPDNQPVLSSRELNYAQDDIFELISACQQGVGRVASIVQSLKTFSRKEQNELHTISMNEVIESAIEMVWNQLKYHNQLEKALLEPAPGIIGNFGQLQQVFVNLLVNAVQATPEQGVIRITTHVEEEQLVVKVADQGFGIDEESMSHIFEPFFTTKNENEGTGLGLSVSYAIIEQHHATISVASVVNKGTTFTLKFPLATT